jgi:hypothetical protein
VGDQVQGDAGGAGAADLLGLEERRACHQPPAAHGGQQRHTPFDRDQPGRGAGGQHGGGQVDQFAVLVPRAGGDHHGGSPPSRVNSRVA